MGFKFSFLVELLEDLERNRFRKASKASRSANPDHVIIVHWFNKFDAKIQRTRDEGVAFLSCLFPERRPDRSFHMQETRLASVFGRIYQLGTTRLNELRTWKTRKPADFASCLESILAQAEMPTPFPGNEVTLEEINHALNRVASRMRASGPTIRANESSFNTVDLLSPILLRLRSVDAKWLVRMLLKSYHPVDLPESLTMVQFHFLLPNLLAVQNNFGAAMSTLNQAEFLQLPNRVSKADAVMLRTRLEGRLLPMTGVMIKRQPYYKARSIKHCCQMAAQKVMSVEQKYDGEYCQVHIDMSKPNGEQIQIFSKSGRDSTQDRIRLHNAVEASLNLRSQSQQCTIKERCILEGELLIYSGKNNAIQPFHRIRKHCQHAGRFLDHEADSPIRHDEQVMIMYYDLLLLDHKILLERPQEERRRHLERLISPTKGLAELGVRHVIDFRTPEAPEHLRKIFAACISQRLEGFVLKSCKDPYFSCTSTITGIKLKKDYMTNLGDVADLAFIGARLDPKAQRKLKQKDLRWNSFYVGCLQNKDEVIRYNTKPVFRMIGEVSFMSQHDMEYLNIRGQILAVSFVQPSDYMDVSTIPKNMKTPDVLFKTPFVVEVLGSGYDRAPNSTHWVLRHPRLHKIHEDHSITDTCSFDDLQRMAAAANTARSDGMSQEDREWMEKLEKADPKSKHVLDTSPATSSRSGQTPDSLVTASPTRQQSVSRSPPFVIWSDFNQTPPAIANRTFSQESSPLVTSEKKNVLKRKRDGGAEPWERKRRKLSPLDSSSPPDFNKPQVSSRSSVSKRIPCCRRPGDVNNNSSSPFEPPAVFRSLMNMHKSSKQPAIGKEPPTSPKTRREPLKFMANPPSPVLKKTSLPPNRLDHSAQQNQQQQHQQITTKEIEMEEAADVNVTKSIKTTLPNRPDITTLPLPLPFPTPPSTAEEIGERQSQPPPSSLSSSSSSSALKENPRENGYNQPPRPGPLPHSPSPPAPSPPAPSPPRPTSAPLSAMSPPILLHLHGPLSSLPPTVLATLQFHSGSFTFSASHFLTNILPFHGTTVILLDSVSGEAMDVARVIHGVMREMLGLKIRIGKGRGGDEKGNGKKGGPTVARGKGRVMFFDWRALSDMKEVSSEDEIKEIPLVGSRRYFAGCLKWRCRDGKENGQSAERSEVKLDVTECFDWKEAILLDDGSND